MSEYVMVVGVRFTRVVCELSGSGRETEVYGELRICDARTKDSEYRAMSLIFATHAEQFFGCTVYVNSELVVRSDQSLVHLDKELIACGAGRGTERLIVMRVCTWRVVTVG